MKRKRVQTPWAALRAGFTNRDWAASWVDVLGEAGLPGDDFVLKGVSRDASNFTQRIAGFNDGISMMRMLLILAGMEADAAIKFTLHSWRHLVPTMSRQLRLPEAEQIEIGHWSTGSAMPRKYDVAACVTELSAKQAILNAVANGWQVADPGCVAMPPPPTCAANSVPGASANPTAKKPGCFAKSGIRKPNAAPPLQTFAKLTRVPETSACLLDIGRQVTHLHTGRIHLWRAGDYTICNSWKCGSPENAAGPASFIPPGKCLNDTPLTPHCRSCYSDRLSFLRIPTAAPAAAEAADGNADDTNILAAATTTAAEQTLNSDDSNSSETCSWMEVGSDDGAEC